MSEICPRCMVVLPAPCVTPSGAIARAPHKDRPELKLGVLEGAAVSSLEAAGWLTDADQVAAEVLLGLVRQMDRAATASGVQMGLLDDVAPPSSKVIGEKDKAYTWVASVAVQYLDKLGLTVAGRHAMRIEGEEDFDELDDAVRKLLAS